MKLIALIIAVVLQLLVLFRVSLGFDMQAAAFLFFFVSFLPIDRA